jgi:MacB-like periplasmic core domain
MPGAPGVGPFAGGERGQLPTAILVMVTSPDLFDLLGVQPVLGRGFAKDEGGPKRPPVIVLTDEPWHRVGADPAILRATVRLNGEPYTVIGVLPPKFGFVRNASLGPPQRADAYTTLNVNLAETNPGAGSYAGFVRARRGTSPQAVDAAVDAVGRMVDARDFKSRTAGRARSPAPLRTESTSARTHNAARRRRPPRVSASRARSR